jgi:hypothetical protein
MRRAASMARGKPACSDGSLIYQINERAAERQQPSCNTHLSRYSRLGDR